MAIACFGFVTFLPLRPDFSLPRFIACISRFTSSPADGEYFRPDDFFFEDDDFFDEVLLREELLFFVLLFFALLFFAELFLLLDFFLVAMHYPPSNSDVP